MARIARAADSKKVRVLSGPRAGETAPLKTACLLVLVAGATAFAHWPALSAGALSFDDTQYLLNNYLVRNPSWTNAWQFTAEVLEPSTVGGYYQPLNMISLMVDSALGGSPRNLRPYHRTSLALHVANTVLVVVLLTMLFGAVWIAAAVGVLFGVHPLTVEPIPWIGERKTLLATFFALWSLIAYIHYARSAGDSAAAGPGPAAASAPRRGTAAFVLCHLFFVLALLAKPTTTPLPVMFLLMDAWPLGRIGRRAVIEKIPLVVIAAVFSLITYVSQSRTANVVLPGEQSPFEAPLRICHNIAFYPFKIICPANLTSHYATPRPLDLTQSSILAGVIGTTVILILLVVSLRRTRALLVGWLIFFVALLPTTQIFGFSNVIASDKYAYFPSVGLLMIVTWALVGGRRRLGSVRWVRVAAPLVFIVLAASETVATRRYLTRWVDTETLYQHMISVTPNASILHSVIGNTYYENGRIDESIAEHQIALKHAWGSGRIAEVCVDLGNALRAKGRLNDAIASYREALRLHPDFCEAHTNLGLALSEAGRMDEAAKSFAESIRLKPRNPEAHCLWAAALLKAQRLDEAVVHLRAAVAQRPLYPEAHNNLAIALDALGKPDEALKHFYEIVRINPESVEGRYNLAVALQRRKRWDEAARQFREVLRLDPYDAGARKALEEINSRRSERAPP
jgi:tetratricopeptide (TPR) repeat protein